jgi:hypothetical protein
MTEIRRGWFAKPSMSVIAMQWIGNLLIFLFGSAWLQIPDSHAWQFVFSVVSGVLLVVAFCWLQLATFARVHKDGTRGQFWLRIISFAAIALLLFFAEQWISSIPNRLELYPAYWNSKLSPGARVLFTPGRIVTWINLLITLAEWLVFGLLLPAMIAVSTLGPTRSARVQIVRPYRKVFYWLAVFIACFGTTQITTALVSWMPGTGVTGEIVSVLARLGVAYTVDILLWCVLLALTAAWMENDRAVAVEPAVAPE